MNENLAKFVKAMKNTSIVLLIVGAIVAVVFLGTSVYVVDQTENAVVTRFGKFLKINEAGLHFQLGFGIDHHYIVNVTNYNTEQFGFKSVKGSGRSTNYKNNADESTMLTGDLNIVEVEWIVQYKISDPKAWVFNVDNRLGTIRDVSRSAINMLVGDRGIMDIMGAERSNIENEAVKFMNETFTGYKIGITVIAVKLQNIDPPAGVQEAFDDVNKAEQDKNRLINEGQQAYNAAIPRAHGEADRRIQIAKGYAAERINNANGDVARFNSVYEEYRKAPEVTRERLYYEMMENVFSGNDNGKTTTIIDKDFKNFLPIKNLGSQTSSVQNAAE
ncbi:MAG: FtsH protease activity modulator HflK [Termitinemataceae bacterium]|nr:MAG: FtsH protease activity modulator HflK [Termitinemataceae bacterium]